MTELDTRFVVFTTQRSGSTWLMSVLNSLDNVSAQGELFLPRPRSPHIRWDSSFARPRYVESRAEFGSVRPLSVFRYLHDFYGTHGSVGFKLMYSQVKTFPEVLMFLKRNDILVVHLIRRNHLDVLISFALKRRIGQAHILSAADRPREDVTVTLEPRSLLKDIERLHFKHTVARKLLALCRFRHTEIFYEDLVADSAHFDRVFRFLRIPAPDTMPESTILKTRVGSQSAIIANYEEVRRVLSESRFAYLLQEDD